MNITIVGPGAMGLLFAGYLHKTDAKLLLVDNVQEHADRLNKQGIRWEGADSDFNFMVPVTVGLKNPEKTDLIIICVKAYSTDAASREIARSGYSGPVLTLQNGLGNAEVLMRNLPESPVITGSTSEGATLVDVSHVRHAGKGETAFGPVTSGRPGKEFLEGLADLMTRAGLDVEITADPLSLVWNKALINAGINPLTAILQVQNGRLLELGPARKLMGYLVAEGREVLTRKGIKLLYDDPAARAEEVCRLTASNYSSMCQDIMHGRPTEIDFINGAIAREGAELGLCCPYNEAVTELVRSLERIGPTDCARKAP